MDHVIGAFPILSLMVGAVVTRLVPDEGPSANITGFEGLSLEQQRVLVASSVTFLMGAFQVYSRKDKSHFTPIYIYYNFFSYYFSAHNGSAAGGLYCHVSVRYSGVRIHHCSCRSHFGIPAQVCVGTGLSWYKRATCHCICKLKFFSFIAPAM